MHYTHTFSYKKWRLYEMDSPFCDALIQTPGVLLVTGVFAGYFYQLTNRRNSILPGPVELNKLCHGTPPALFKWPGEQFCMVVGGQNVRGQCCGTLFAVLVSLFQVGVCIPDRSDIQQTAGVDNHDFGQRDKHLLESPRKQYGHFRPPTSLGWHDTKH